MHTAAGHPGDGRLGVGRKLRQVTPPTQVNKQKPPPSASARGRAHGGRGQGGPRTGGTRDRREGGGSRRAPGHWQPRRAGVPRAQSRPRARGRRAHSPSWWNCSSSSFRGPRPGAPSRGGWRRCPRRRRSALPPSGGLASFVALVTLRAGLPGARTHAHAGSPPLGALHPGAHAARSPERPATPGAPRAVSGRARAPRFHPAPLTLRVQSKGRNAQPELVRSPHPPLFLTH